MEATDFAPGFPGRLVPMSLGVVAFVPDPLPPRMPLSDRAIGLLAGAEAALGELQGAAGRLVNPYLVSGPLLRREAILSSRMEGTYTTPEQLVLLEAAERPGRHEAEASTREVLNYVRAMEQAIARLGTLPLSLRLIREIHRVLMDGVRGGQERPGEFRDAQNWIGRRGESIRTARYVPPPVAEMLACLDQLEKFLHRDRAPEEAGLPVLVECALVHYQFEAIRPFRDGNGRVGRLLIPLLLITRGRMRDPLLYLSAFFERSRDEYIDGLQRVSTHGEWMAWVEYFLLAVRESAEDTLRRVEAGLALRARYHDRFQSARSSALLLKLVDGLFQVPSITLTKAATLLRVTPAAAAQNIGKLVDAGVLREATGRKRDRVFIAPEIVALLGDGEEASQ